MAEVAHSISPSELRQLSGSSPPGAGRPVFRPATAPRPKPQARPRLHDEREIMALAGRIAALVNRENDLSLRIAKMDPSEIPLEQEERLDKIFSRMVRRVTRWVRQLAAMKAATLEAAAAKAIVYTELNAAAWDSDSPIAELGLSLARDLRRIGLESACSPQIPRAYDGTAETAAPDLLVLIDSHAPALAASAEADTALSEALARFNAAESPKPAGVYWRACDGMGATASGRERSPSGGWRMFYTESDIADLREMPEPCHLSSGSVGSSEGAGMAWRPDTRRIARKAEILAAFAEMKAQRVALAQEVGWTAARAEFTRRSAEARRIENDILEHNTLTLADVQAKARWIERQDMVEEWSDFVLYDVCALNDTGASAESDLAPAFDARAA